MKAMALIGALAVLAVPGNCIVAEIDQSFDAKLANSFSELYRAKTKYRAIRDRGIRLSDDNVRRKKARDLLRAALMQTEALQEATIPSSASAEAIVARMSLLPVLLDFAYQVVALGREPQPWKMVRERVTFARGKLRKEWRKSSAKLPPDVSSDALRAWADDVAKALPSVQAALKEALNVLNSEWRIT